MDDRMSTTLPLTISDDDEDEDADINTATIDLRGQATRKSRKPDEKGDVKASSGDDDCEEEEEEDQSFQLEFTVPVGAASDTITMSSDIGYTEFFQNIADTMDVRKKDLNIAYKLNFKKELKATIIDLRPKPGKEKPGKSTKKPASKYKRHETELNSDEDDDESQARRGKKSKAEVLRELEEMSLQPLPLW
ncbi:hypothetical protein B0H14DRAFT_3496572 [Mycena olivaceomarginata]|nr:hypothetical protein B0H14DRAFT_3496572 [Mycena olivaceomarginata]